MEIEKTTADNNLSNEEWMLILLMLILEDERQKDETWNQFETELIYKNRFFSDSPIVKEIHKRAAQATTIIPAGSLFYRARVYKRELFVSNDKLFLCAELYCFAFKYKIGCTYCTHLAAH